jgi:hypothetical protein
MKSISTVALVIYAGIITFALAWLLLVPNHHQTFETIDVHRINVRENDGTIRLVLSSRDQFPGWIGHNKEHPHPGRADAAGLVFYNDEGTENGGLIIGGKKVDGKVVNFGHLSFDQYDQDQVVKLEQTEEDGQRISGLSIDDRPNAPLNFEAIDQLSKLPPAQRDAALQELKDSGVFGYRRGFFGKNADQNTVLDLHDRQGRVRLRLQVTAGGDAAIDFLNAEGRVVKRERPPSTKLESSSGHSDAP